MVYGINGWQNGGRQSLTTNLRPGQFRGMGKPHVFTAPTYIQNNYYGSNMSCGHYDYGCCGGNSTPTWMTALMTVGLGLPLIGNILEWCGVGKTDGVGGTEGEKEKVKEEKSTDNGLLSRIEILERQNRELQAKLDAKSTAQPTVADPNDGKGDGRVLTKPNLYNSATMANLADADAVLARFKADTGREPKSIDDAITAGGLKFNQAVDKGLKGNHQFKDLGEIEISAARLQELKDGGTGTTVALGNGPDGHPITAENLDGYIRITAGPDKQTYILADDGKVYQHAQDGNVEGFGGANWKSSITPGGAGNSGSTVGWYNAGQDKSGIDKNLTRADLAQYNKAPKQAAKYVASVLLSDKNISTSAQNTNIIEKLADEIIKNNPSVFDKSSGMLKETPDMSKLDIPNHQYLKDFIKQNGGGVTPSSVKDNTDKGGAAETTEQTKSSTATSIDLDKVYLLRGRTKTEQYTDIKNELNKITSDNVLNFVTEYENRRGFPTDSILKQIYTEGEDDNFKPEERKAVTLKIINAVIQKAEASNITNSNDLQHLKHCRDLINSGQYTRNIAYNADQYILNLNQVINQSV